MASHTGDAAGAPATKRGRVTQPLSNIVLTVGGHSDPAAGLCVMEAIALFVGELHGDWPDCVCPVLIEFGRVLNDALPDRWRTDLLLPLVPLLVGSRDPQSNGRDGASTRTERKRAALLIEACVNARMETNAYRSDEPDPVSPCVRVEAIEPVTRAAEHGHDSRADFQERHLGWFAGPRPSSRRSMRREG